MTYKVLQAGKPWLLALVAGSLVTGSSTVWAMLTFAVEETSVNGTPSVVVNVSGSVDLSGLTLFSQDTRSSFTAITGNRYRDFNSTGIAVGVSPAQTDRYLPNFNDSVFSTCDCQVESFTLDGDFVAITQDFDERRTTLQLPAGYVSGTELSGSAVFTGQSLATLELQPGTYDFSNPPVRVEIGTGSPIDPDIIELIFVDLPLEPGKPFGATSLGWAALSEVDANLESTPVFLGSAVSNAQGEVSFSLVVPADFPPGEHTLVLKGTGADNNPRRLTTPITIAARPRDAGPNVAAVPGMNSWGVGLLIALMALLAGVSVRRT